MSGEKWLGVAAFAAAAFLVYVITDRLDTQALAVLVGVACGAMAGVPLTVAAFWIQRGRRKPVEQVSQWRERPPAPQVIVVQPSAPAPVAPPANGWVDYGRPQAPARPSRRFNIIGEEDEDGNP